MPQSGTRYKLVPGTVPLLGVGMKRARSYKQAGVDVKLARRFIQAIQPLAHLTRRPGLLRGIGGFGGLFELRRPQGNGSPILVASADGVGTKLRLAQLSGWYDPLGVDLVAMNVNDLLCAGAEPLFFLDYIATGKLDPRLFVGIIRGIVRGCLESSCVLLGGETAQMSLVYRAGDFDLAGFAVGVVDRRRLVTGEKIRVGDCVLGLASNGLHANGFTLVQRVLPRRKLMLWARELLRPTRIYVRPVLNLLRRGIPLHGIAHITGGSFSEKIPRILPDGLGVRLYEGSWPVPLLFKRIEAAGVPHEEMLKTFNMGLGMVLIVPKKKVSHASRILQQRGIDNWVVGAVTRGRREVTFA